MNNETHDLYAVTFGNQLDYPEQGTNNVIWAASCEKVIFGHIHADLHSLVSSLGMDTFYCLQS